MASESPKTAIANHRIIALLRSICGSWGAQMLVSQLRDKYGLLTENEGGCDEEQLEDALRKIFGDSLMSTFKEMLSDNPDAGDKVSLP